MAWDAKRHCMRSGIIFWISESEIQTADRPVSFLDSANKLANIFNRFSWASFRLRSSDTVHYDAPSRLQARRTTKLLTFRGTRSTEIWRFENRDLNCNLNRNLTSSCQMIGKVGRPSQKRAFNGFGYPSGGSFRKLWIFFPLKQNWIGCLVTGMQLQFALKSLGCFLGKFFIQI